MAKDLPETMRCDSHSETFLNATGTSEPFLFQYAPGDRKTAWTVFSRAHTPFAHTLTHQPLQPHRVSGETVQQKECLNYNLSDYRRREVKNIIFPLLYREEEEKKAGGSIPFVRQRLVSVNVCLVRPGCCFQSNEKSKRRWRAHSRVCACAHTPTQRGIDWWQRAQAVTLWKNIHLCLKVTGRQTKQRKSEVR